MLIRLIQVYDKNIVFILKINYFNLFFFIWNRYKLPVTFIFLMIFCHIYQIIFFVYFLCFPTHIHNNVYPKYYQSYKISVNGIRDFIFKNYCKKKLVFLRKTVSIKWNAWKERLAAACEQIYRKIPDTRMLSNTINHL